MIGGIYSRNNNDTDDDARSVAIHARRISLEMDETLSYACAVRDPNIFLRRDGAMAYNIIDGYPYRSDDVTVRRLNTVDIKVLSRLFVYAPGAGIRI